MMRGHRIKKTENIETFLKKVQHYEEKNIECTAHTLFRLSEKQRKLFKCKDIKRFLLEEKPTLVGIQYNGNYAIFYKHEKQRFIKIIISIKSNVIKIVTFYIIEKYQLPRVIK